MTMMMKMAGLSLAALLMASNTLAQDLSANPQANGPGSHGGPITGGDQPQEQHGGGPITGGDNPLPGEGDGGDHTHPHEPPTHTPTTGGPSTGGPAIDSDTTPTGELGCFYFSGWVFNGESHAGAFLTNTGNTVIHQGTIVRFMLNGSIVEMTLPYDVVPEGQWSWYVDGNPILSFPTGTEVPANGACDIEVMYA